MTKKFAQYLTTLITNDVENKMSEGSMGISSYECEKVEAALMADKFDDVEKWVGGKTKGSSSKSKNISKIIFDPKQRTFSGRNGVESDSVDSSVKTKTKSLWREPDVKIDINFKNVRSVAEAKSLIAEKLGLKNDFTLDALYDHLTSISKDTRIILSYWYRRGEYLDKVCKVIDDASEANDNLDIWKSK